MKKLLFMALAFFSASAFANICYVDLVDKYSHYRYDTFSGYSYNGVCRDGLRDCNRALRQGNYDPRSVSCVQRDNRRGPNRPYPPRNDRYLRLLNMTDYQVADYALRGQVGSCRVERGSVWQSCNYYVKVNRRGYPQGTGCSDRMYTSRYGCNSYSDKNNAGCLIKKAIRQGNCR